MRPPILVAIAPVITASGYAAATAPEDEEVPRELRRERLRPRVSDPRAERDRVVLRVKVSRDAASRSALPPTVARRVANALRGLGFERIAPVREERWKRGKRSAPRSKLRGIARKPTSDSSDRDRERRGFATRTERAGGPWRRREVVQERGSSRGRCVGTVTPRPTTTLGHFHVQPRARLHRSSVERVSQASGSPSHWSSTKPPPVGFTR